MRVVALVSAYREGPLVHNAIASALTATADVLVFEGPAGEPLEADVPDTDYTRWLDEPEQLVDASRAQHFTWGEKHGAITLVRGEWDTDAAKRTAMIEACRKWRGEEVWGVWIDGDELLRNGDTLHDWVQYWTWRDEVERRADAEAVATMGYPIRLVELDGTVMLCRAKVVRVDLIDSYSVSSSVFKNVLGQVHGEGNVPEKLSDDFGRRLMIASGADRMIVPSWIVAEPYLVHRSMLRHPDRQPLRMHEQEAVELEKAQRPRLTLLDQIAP